MPAYPERIDEELAFTPPQEPPKSLTVEESPLGLICGLCGGPIGVGEPVTGLLAGDLAHRFRTTCEYQLELDLLEAI